MELTPREQFTLEHGAFFMPDRETYDDFRKRVDVWWAEHVAATTDPMKAMG